MPSSARVSPNFSAGVGGALGGLSTGRSTSSPAFGGMSAGGLVCPQVLARWSSRHRACSQGMPPPSVHEACATHWELFPALGVPRLSVAAPQWSCAWPPVGSSKAHRGLHWMFPLARSLHPNVGHSPKGPHCLLEHVMSPPFGASSLQGRLSSTLVAASCAGCMFQLPITTQGEASMPSQQINCASLCTLGPAYPKGVCKWIKCVIQDAS